jgi:hypothetical protein
MRGEDRRSGGLFSYVDREARVPADHPLRPMRRIVDDALSGLSSELEALYSHLGRPSIAPERLLMEQLQRNATPHVAQNTSGRRSRIDRRTVRHPGYLASQRARKRIEEACAWVKTIAGRAKTRFRGTARVGWAFTLAAAAYNLIRLPKLLAAAP